MKEIAQNYCVGISDPTMKYERHEGWYVTTKKALALAIFAVLTLIFIILYMYYYGPNVPVEKIKVEESDIETIIQVGLEKKVRRNIRLPQTLIPFHYNLKIHPIFTEGNSKNISYKGKVEIYLNCKIDTKKVVLNWDRINVLEQSIMLKTVISTPIDNFSLNVTNLDLKNVSSSLTNANNDSTSEYRLQIDSPEAAHILRIDRVDTDFENLKFIIMFEEVLEAGKSYSLIMEFSGQILENLVGLYKTSYSDSTGENKWLLTTQFQPIYARTVFPCFDEPTFKSTFDISIARSENMTVLSNMPLKKSEQMNNVTGWLWDHFERTLPMPTYLIAFTIFDFKSITCKSSCYHSNITVWTPPDDLAKGQFALELATEIMKFLENYFDIKYPLPKIDLLAMPDLGQEATDNWGLISFRKRSLLHDPNQDSLLLRPKIFNILCKQLSLLWLGNLVSIEWWEDLWFVEGFSRFISTEVEKKLRPLWNTYNNNPHLALYNSLFFDSLKSARSIQNKIIDNEQIEQIADTVVYDKGSSLLRMLNYTMTGTIFQRALKNYLRKFEYKTASTKEFWTFLQNFENASTYIPSNLTVEQFMNSWTYQPGYPCLQVERNIEYITITQNRFIEAETKMESTNSWYMPVSYITKESNVTRRKWLQNTKMMTFKNYELKNNSWILFNIRREGFYRVNYDSQNWNLLKDQLEKNFQLIPALNRAQILDDAFVLAKMGFINYSVPFELTNYLKFNETAYIAWFPALQNLNHIRIVMDYNEHSGIFDTFLINLVRKRFESLGTYPTDEESLNDKMLRLTIIELACQLHLQPCIEWALSQFQTWKDQPNSNPILHDYRRIVQCISIERGGRAEWNFLWEKTLSSKISPEDLKIVYLTLGCTRDSWLINRYLHFALNGNMSLENVPLVWKSLNHPVGLRTGFAFLRLNWKRIFNTYTEVYFVLKSIIGDFLSNLATEIDIEDLTQFYKLHKNDLESYATVMQATVDKIKLRIEWKEKYLTEVVSWLQEHSTN